MTFYISPSHVPLTRFSQKFAFGPSSIQSCSFFEYPMANFETKEKTNVTRFLLPKTTKSSHSGSTFSPPFVPKSFPFLAPPLFCATVFRPSVFPSNNEKEIVPRLKEQNHRILRERKSVEKRFGFFVCVKNRFFVGESKDPRERKISSGCEESLANDSIITVLWRIALLPSINLCLSLYKQSLNSNFFFVNDLSAPVLFFGTLFHIKNLIRLKPFSWVV